MKKTKIVATMSDFRCTEEFVKNLFDAGMDVVRVNSAHVSEEGATHIVETVHRVNPAIPIMIDTKGPEIRVTTIADEYGNSINFRPGDRVAVRGSDGSDFTTRKVVYMNVPSIVSDIPVGARMLIADGELEIRVVGKNDTELDCEFVVGGAMRSRKSVNVPGVSIDLPSVTEKDRRFIEWAVKNDVDFIAHSFVRSARDIRAVQDILDAHGSNIKIISKIENQEGIDNIDEILTVADGIMVARGDMGVEIDFAEIPAIQKHLIDRAMSAGKICITATQMLDSMIVNPRPTRAEITDVANAIYDGTSAIMLSGETAAGRYPVEAVKTMDAIARKTESSIDCSRVAVLPAHTHLSVTAATAHAACTTAEDIGADAILTVSQGGITAQMVSRFRPEATVVALLLDPQIRRQMALYWGLVPIMMKRAENSDELVHSAVETAQRAGLVKHGDLVVITAGVPVGVSGTTNMIRIEQVGGALVNGTGIGDGTVSGPLCVCRTPEEVPHKFRTGDVLVVPYTNNDLLPYMKEAAAVISEEISPEGHTATVGLLLHKPVIIGAVHATRRLSDGVQVSVDCARGIVQVMPQ